MGVTAGKTFKVSSIAITDREGKQEEIKLEGKGSPSGTPEVSGQATAHLRVQSVPGGFGVIAKDGKILARAKTKDKANALMADMQHGPLQIKTIRGTTETVPAETLKQSGEGKKAANQPQTAHNDDILELTSPPADTGIQQYIAELPKEQRAYAAAAWKAFQELTPEQREDLEGQNHDRWLDTLDV